MLSNALEPGWVATRMDGPNAPDDLDAGHRTQVWLAVSNDKDARVSGQHFYHMPPLAPNAVARSEEAQDRLLEECQRLSGVVFPP